MRDVSVDRKGDLIDERRMMRRGLCPNPCSDMTGRIERPAISAAPKARGQFTKL